MLHLTNVLALVYILFLFIFKRKYLIGLSMYWMLVFYAIYILTPIFRNYTTLLNGITDQVVEKVALYSLVGLISFILANFFSLFSQKRRMTIFLKKSMLQEIPYKTIEKLLSFFVLVSIALLFLSVRANEILWRGSRNVLIMQNEKSTLTNIFQLSVFYVTILGSIFVLAAKNSNQRYKSIVVFVLILAITSFIAFARRYVIYPMFAVVLYLLLHEKNRIKAMGLMVFFVLIFFISMFLMGYFRSFGIANFSISKIIHYFQYDVFIDVMLSNADFIFPYMFLSEQVEYGEILVGPLGYFKMFFLLIPRSVWPNKPNYTSISILSIIEPIKVRNGFSAGTGYIGEALATLSIPGLILISVMWGLFCGWLDREYLYFREKEDKSNNMINKRLTFFEYYYIYTGVLLITESHRGDFGAASIHFVLEIIVLGLMLKFLK